MDRTMFLPTPSATIASSRPNIAGSSATAITAFVSQPYRKTNVSWPVNEKARDAGAGASVARSRRDLRIRPRYSNTERQIELTVRNVIEQPLNCGSDELGLVDLPL